MKAVKQHENWLGFIGALTKTFYYFIYLPCALILAALILLAFIGASDKHSVFASDYFLLAVLGLSILVPLVYRRLNILNRRKQLNNMLALLISRERFNPQRHHQILDASRGKYFGIDTERGTLLYIHIAKKDVVNVVGLTMRDWAERELEGSTLRLHTRNAKLPVLSINAHQSVAKELFNVLGAMNCNSFSEPFPNEPWPEHVGIQSRFVEYEHNVVVPQAV